MLKFCIDLEKELFEQKKQREKEWIEDETEREREHKQLKE